MSADNLKLSVQPYQLLKNLQMQMLTAISFAMSIFLLLWLGACSYLVVSYVWYGIVLCQLISTLAFAHYWWSKNFTWLRRTQILFLLLTPLVVQLSIVGAHLSGIVFWSFLAPLAAFLVGEQGKTRIGAWGAAYLATIACAYALVWQQGVSIDLADAQLAQFLMPINFALLSGLVAWSLYYYSQRRTEIEQLRKNQFFDLRTQHDVANSSNQRNLTLINNLLPDRIAHRLLDAPAMIADGHADVTVMFADLVGFSKMSDSLSAQQIVLLLNRLFSGFDAIADLHGLEKIKTIGDAYMCVGGLQAKAGEDYLYQVLLAAEEFNTFISSELSGEFADLELQLHIGIATGAVVAGVIGRIRLTYDVWGKTVNMASRLCDGSRPGQVLLDRTSRQRMEQHFEFEPVPDLTLKGGTQLPAYALLRHKSS
ncbi:MAG: adenylate/guanylate cyclase domain-containing protein [Sideroxydans sp.]|nr:adenylate/guanylate cyclase domain-containing protein [Sideroxydans sp.]